MGQRAAAALAPPVAVRGLNLAGRHPVERPRGSHLAGDEHHRTVREHRQREPLCSRATCVHVDRDCGLPSRVRPVGADDGQQPHCGLACAISEQLQVLIGVAVMSAPLIAVPGAQPRPSSNPRAAQEGRDRSGGESSDHSARGAPTDERGRGCGPAGPLASPLVSYHDVTVRRWVGAGKVAPPNLWTVGAALLHRCGGTAPVGRPTSLSRTALVLPPAADHQSLPGLGDLAP